MSDIVKDAEKRISKVGFMYNTPRPTRDFIITLIEKIKLEENFNSFQIKKCREYVDEILDKTKALELAHTTLTAIPDWPDTEHDHYVSETIESALEDSDAE